MRACRGYAGITIIVLFRFIFLTQIDWSFIILRGRCTYLAHVLLNWNCTSNSLRCLYFTASDISNEMRCCGGSSRDMFTTSSEVMLGGYSSQSMPKVNQKILGFDPHLIHGLNLRDRMRRKERSRHDPKLDHYDHTLLFLEVCEQQGRLRSLHVEDDATVPNR